MREIKLPVIGEPLTEIDAIEARLREYFKKLIYQPLIEMLGVEGSALKNSVDPKTKALTDALFKGTVTFNRGTFSGKFSARVSAGLKAIGATFDRKSGTFKLPTAKLPQEVQNVVHASDDRFAKVIAKIDKRLAQILPDEIADAFKCEDLFDRAIFKTDKAFRESIGRYTLAPELTKDDRARIADEWQNNLELYIKDFTKKETKALRAKMEKSVFAGNRYGSAVDSIAKSYGVSVNKAKFLARQETSLLTAKLTEIRYQDAGIDDYIWECVTGTKDHPVRPEHLALKGTRQKFSQPPISSKDGRRNNPKQDYNCRCRARPIIKFRI